MSSQFLTQYAVDNSWCDPLRDKQFHVQGRRITVSDSSKGMPGAINHVKIMGRRYGLPEAGKRFHVFFIGQVQAQVMNLLYGRINAQGVTTVLPNWIRNVWMNFGGCMRSQKLMVDIYAANGEKVPVNTSWYMFTEHSALVFCIEENSDLALNYNADTLCLRVYSNHYFRTGNANHADDYIESKLFKDVDADTRYNAASYYASLLSKQGKPLCFVNGYKVPSINQGLIPLGSTVEVFYDGSIKATRTFPVSTLQGFMSVRDSGVSKLLVHSNDPNTGEVEFVDDCDIYVRATVKRVVDGTEVDCDYAYMLGGHLPSNKRQVTHMDYSISYDAMIRVAQNLKADLESDWPTKLGVVNGVTTSVQQILSVNDFVIEVVVRKDGYNQPLVDNACHLQDLYSLAPADILKAMVGVTATVPEWTAAQLENSAFIRHLDASYFDLTPNLLKNAYGYNAISKIVGNTPQKLVDIDPGVSSEIWSATLPVQLRTNSTAYVYDTNGYLIDVVTHASGDAFSTTNTNARMVEVLSGIGTDEPSTVFGVTGIPVPANYNYKVYKCQLVAGVPNDQWVDITGSSLYTVTGGVLSWVGANTGQYLAVRDDSKFLHLSVPMEPINGIFEFTLAQKETRLDGTVTRTLTIPYGQMDVIMNGKSLIQGIEYYVDFPKVRIISKQHLVQPVSAPQSLVVRCYGFCNSDMSVDPVEDHGFVEHGYLSNNTRFDIRRDKVNRIIVGGSLKHIDDVQFSEEHSGVQITHTLNGKPYEVKDIIVPMRGYIEDDTYSLRNIALATDARVGNFLSSYIDPFDRGNLMQVQARTSVYSPFFSRVIEDMLANVITTAQCQAMESDQDILDFFVTYDSLFIFDPLSPSNHTDFRYILVEPTLHSVVQVLNVDKYRVLSRLAAMYGRGQVVMNSHIVIG